MSKQVDERVVSMQFDNRHFESNVKTTMSTLDRLKQKLNLKGASKGLDDLNSAAKNVNMSGLGSAVETVRAKFSALEVMGVTALANITNSAVNAGKRIVSALTIDPIKTGLKEYETQINAVQTIMANTQSKGTTLDDVNKALDELNKYADLTIYNFTEMTRNIGTFTAAGVDLDTSVNAIKGIANLAAVSGSTSQQASTAMYQLSQALASGSVKLMDWNSVVNAGMGGQVFQDSLKETARVHGVAIDEMIEKEGSFRETLSNGWLTSEILTETLQKFTLTTEGLTEAEIEKNRQMLKGKGYTDEQIDSIFKLGNTATDAATKVKTFSQMWDVLKESAQSGWSQTWKIIFGDFEEAKAIFTPLTNFFTGIIQKISDARNTLLEGALGKGLQNIFDKINGSSIGKTAKAISNVTNSLGYYQGMVNKIWRGDYKNQPVRSDLLEDEGHNYKVLQSLVNKGYQYKLTMDDVTKAEKEFGTSLKNTSKEAEKTEAAIESLSDKQLKNIGLTEDEIREYRALEEQSEKTGKSISELLEEMQETDGRTLLIESLKNAGSGLVTVFSNIGKAWKEVFPPVTSVQLYNVIKGLNEFSENLIVGEETADKLRRTFKGVFAILDIVATLVAGPIKIAFKAVTQLLGMFDLNILDVTASIGDALVGFRDWIDSTLDFSKAFEKIIPFLKDAGKALREWFDGLKTADNIPKYIVSGLVNGLIEGGKLVWNSAIELGRLILEGIKNFLGIHSPSTKFMEVGKNIIDGLIKGLQNGASAVWETIKSIASKCVEIIKNIDFGALLAAGIGIGIVSASNKIGNALVAFSAPFEGLGDFLENTGEGINKMLTGLGKSFKASAFKKRAQACLSFAIAIGILAASVYVLSKLDVGSMWGAIGALAALAGIIAVLAIAIGKLGPKESIELSKFSIALLAMSGSLFIIAQVLKTLSSLSWGDLAKGGIAIAGLGGIIVGLMAATRLAGKSINKIGPMLLKISAAMLLMVFVIKQISKLDAGALAKGGLAIIAFGGIVVGLTAITNLASGGKHIDKLGAVLLKISAAMLLMILVIKLVSKMDGESLAKGLLTITLFSGIIVGLIAATRLGGKDFGKIGSTILAVSGAMMLMAVVVRMLSGMNPGDLAKGVLAVTALAGVITGLIASTKLAGKNLKGIASTILAVSISIGILATVAAILGLIRLEHLAKGIVAVGLLSAIIGGLIIATSKAKDCKSNLIVMTVAMGLLAASIAALSFIDSKRLAAATAALSSVMGVFALLIASTNLAKNTKSMRKSLLQMLGVVVVLAAIVAALSLLNPQSVLMTSASLALLLTSFASSLAILGTAGKISSTVSKQIGPMLLVVAGLAAILGILSYLNVEPSIESATALSTLLNGMAIAMVVLSKAGKVSKSSLGSLAIMGLVVGEMAIILGLMSHLNVEPSIETAAALSILLIGMSAACLIASKIPLAGAVKGALGLAAFIGIMGALLAVLGGFSKIPGFNELIKDGGETLALIGYSLGKFVGSIVGGLAAGVTSGLPEVGTNLSMFMENLTPFIEKAKTLTPDSMKGVAALAGVILALTAAEVMNGVMSFVSGGSSFAKLGDDLSDFMSNAAPFIEGARLLDAKMMSGVKTLAETILILTGANLLDGLVSWLTGGSSLSSFGEELSSLGSHLKNFASNLGTFDDSTVSTITCASNAIKVMAEAAREIPNEGGLWAAIVGDNSLATFGSYLPDLGSNLSSFATNLGTFDSSTVDTVTCASNAIKALATAAKEIPNEGGLWSMIVGDNSLATFGSHLPDLAANLSGFASNLGTFDETTVSTVSCAANSIKALATAAKEIPNEGGLWAAIVGDNSLATFGGHLPGLGLNLRDFASNLGTFDETTVATLTCAANAIKAMASAAKDLPNEGGLWSAIVGENSLATFGGYLPTLGSNLRDFASNLGVFDETTVSTVSCAANAIKNMAEAAKNVSNDWMSQLFGYDSISQFGGQLAGLGTNLKTFVTNLGTFGNDQVATIGCATNAIKSISEVSKNISGDWFSKIFGDNGITEFGGQLPGLGTNLKEFMTNLGTFGDDQVATTGAACDALEALSKLSGTDLKEAKKNVEGFGEKLPSLAENLSSFCSKMTGVDASTITSAADNLTTLSGAIKNASAIDSKAVKNFSDSLKTLGANSVDNFVKSFTSNKTTTDVKNAGAKLFSNVIEGVKSKKSSWVSDINALISSGSASIRSKDNYGKFKSAGSYLVDGFAEGISVNSYKAEAKAAAMAIAAYDAAREALDVNSPSKVFRKLGTSIPEGFAMGIDKLGGVVTNSSVSMARTAIDGTKKAISRVVDVMNADIDSQPTIRPVLDLSDVRSGANAINGMLGRTSTVGVMANVGAISSMMNENNQNGNNSDVISAIRDLGKSLGDRTGDTYTINGVTYDDGSNITEAVQTLVRAARVERRR